MEGVYCMGTILAAVGCWKLVGVSSFGPRMSSGVLSLNLFLLSSCGSCVGKTAIVVEKSHSECAALYLLCGKR